MRVETIRTVILEHINKNQCFKKHGVFIIIQYSSPMLPITSVPSRWNLEHLMGMKSALPFTAWRHAIINKWSRPEQSRPRGHGVQPTSSIIKTSHCKDRHVGIISWWMGGWKDVADGRWSDRSIMRFMMKHFKTHRQSHDCHHAMWYQWDTRYRYQDQIQRSSSSLHSSLSIINGCTSQAKTWIHWKHSCFTRELWGVAGCAGVS